MWDHRAEPLNSVKSVNATAYLISILITLRYWYLMRGFLSYSKCASEPISG